MARALFCVLCVLAYGVAAANNDDGFIWIDANTRIKIKPVGNAGSGSTTKAPEPKKEEKKEEPKK